MRYLKVPSLFLVALLAGCANGFLSVAETPAQKGYGIERAYNIVLEDALEIAGAPSTSAGVRQGIQSATATTAPVVDELSDALADFEVERALLATGQSTKDRLAIAATNLERWITQAQAALVSLKLSFRSQE